jgi:hypothetical protein
LKLQKDVRDPRRESRGGRNEMEDSGQATHDNLVLVRVFEFGKCKTYQSLFYGKFVREWSVVSVYFQATLTTGERPVSAGYQFSSAYIYLL